MAKIILGLEISFDEIRYIYIRKRRRGFTLLKKGRLPALDFANLKDPDNLAHTIKEILQQEKLSPAKICLILSNDDFIIHQMSPPKMTEAELNEVIVGEIEGIPKFFNKDFDYIHTSSKLDEQRLRVLFCALSRDTLNSYIQAIKKTGLRLERLEIAPLNLLEILYVYSRVSKNQTQALVVLDEHTSFIMIFGQDGCRLFFQMATGKEDLYVKSSMNKSAFVSWTEEMKRIIRSYQREFMAQAIEKVWLVWDNEKDKELDRLVAEELGTQTIPLRLGDFGGDKKEELNPIFFLSLASPLAYLRGIKQKFGFRHFLSAIILRKVVKKNILLALVYMTALGFLCGLLIPGLILSKKNSEISKKDALQRIAILEKHTASLKNERDSYLESKDRLLRQAAFVRMLNRVSWSKIFATISAVLPQDVSLSRFDVSEAGEIKLEGSTFTIDSIAEMIRKLNAVDFLEDAQFDFLKEREIDKRKIVEFGVVTRLTSQ